jgi:hypothetical protein
VGVPPERGTCTPELAILKSAGPGHLEVKTWYIEGEPPWEGFVSSPNTGSSPLPPSSEGQGLQMRRLTCGSGVGKHHMTGRGGQPSSRFLGPFYKLISLGGFAHRWCLKHLIFVTTDCIVNFMPIKFGMIRFSGQLLELEV